jgi:hypothetical protein
MRNILLITADQYRYDMLGHLGAHPVQTPNQTFGAPGRKAALGERRPTQIEFSHPSLKSTRIL